MQFVAGDESTRKEATGQTVGYVAAEMVEATASAPAHADDADV